MQTIAKGKGAPAARGLRDLDSVGLNGPEHHAPDVAGHVGPVQLGGLLDRHALASRHPHAEVLLPLRDQAFALPGPLHAARLRLAPDASKIAPRFVPRAYPTSDYDAARVLYKSELDHPKRSIRARFGAFGERRAAIPKLRPRFVT